MLFSETQRFRQWWLWLLSGIILVPFLWGAYYQLFIGIPWGDHPLSDLGLIGLVLFLVALFVFLYQIKLETRVTPNAIFFKFFPIHGRFRKIPKDEIDKLEVVKYRPIRDFGGWGIRLGIGVNLAYTVSGNYGLKIFMKSGKVYFLGTINPEELEKAILEFQK